MDSPVKKVTRDLTRISHAPGRCEPPAFSHPRRRRSHKSRSSNTEPPQETVMTVAVSSLISHLLRQHHNPRYNLLPQIPPARATPSVLPITAGHLPLARKRSITDQLMQKPFFPASLRQMAGQDPSLRDSSSTPAPQGILAQNTLRIFPGTW